VNFSDNSMLCYLLSLYYTLKLFVLSYVINGISFTSKWAIEMQIYRIGVYILVNFEFSEISCHDDPDVQNFDYLEAFGNNRANGLDARRMSCARYFYRAIPSLALSYDF